MLSSKVTVSLSMLAVCCLASTANAAQSLSIDFDTNVQPPEFEIVLPTGTSAPPLFQGGQVVFPGTDLSSSRSYLRTVEKNYAAISFLAEITISGGIQNGFFGMGVGDADATNSFGSEPRANPHIYLLMDKDSPTNNGLIDDTGASPNRQATPNVAGVGTHRVRLIWDAQNETAQFFVDRNYDGLSFVPDFTSTLVDGSDNSFSSTTTSIFFGGSTSVVFDDFVVTVVPEPTAIAGLAVAFLGLVGRRRRR